MADETSSRPLHHEAQTYCLLAGIAFLALGGLGFVADSSFDTSHPQGHDLLLFEVNGWHNVLHLASGLLLLAVAPSWRAARRTAKLFGVTYLAVAAWGIVDGDDVLGLVAIDGWDNALHVALGLLGILAAAPPAPGDADALARQRQYAR